LSIQLLSPIILVFKTYVSSSPSGSEQVHENLKGKELLLTLYGVDKVGLSGGELDIPDCVTVTFWGLTPVPETVIVAVLVPGPVLAW